MQKQPAVYILASKRNGTLYVGVTSNLRKRVWEHQNDVIEGFTNARLVFHPRKRAPREDVAAAHREPLGASSDHAH